MAILSVSMGTASVKHTLGELAELSENLREKSIRTVLRDSARPLVEAMRAAAPGRSMLRDSINAKQVKRGDSIKTGAGIRTIDLDANEYGVVVGANVGSKSSVTTIVSSVGDINVRFTRRFKMARYVAWWLEAGTIPHEIKNKRKSGLTRLWINNRWVKGPVYHPGITARHWMSRAAEGSAGMVEQTFYQSLDKQIDKYGR